MKKESIFKVSFYNSNENDVLVKARDAAHAIRIASNFGISKPTVAVWVCEDNYK